MEQAKVFVCSSSGIALVNRPPSAARPIESNQVLFCPFCFSNKTVLRKAFCTGNLLHFILFRRHIFSPRKYIFLVTCSIVANNIML